MPNLPPIVVVTADDFGRSDSICHAVEIAFREGLVTDASLMVNAGSRDLGLEVARRNPGLGIGVHLAFQDVEPLTKSKYVAALKNLSHGAVFIRLLFASSVHIRQVRAEMEAQVKWLVDQGVQPSHINGHNHVHIHPRIRRTVSQLAFKYDIPWKRTPHERNFEHVGVARRAQQVALSFFCMLTSFVRDENVNVPSQFFGFAVSGQMKREHLAKYLAKATSGVTEIICHIGLLDDAPSIDGYSWSSELATITTMSKREAEDAFNVNIAGFHEAARIKAAWMLQISPTRHNLVSK
ncbi:MAG: ChbG/HpnK family deacetylase [Actinomycetota bacterium]